MSAIPHVIEPRIGDLGSIEVRRVLPSGERGALRPLVFFDPMGPAIRPGDVNVMTAVRRTAAYPVELRLKFARAHRGREGRLEEGSLCGRARRSGVHSAAG